MTHLGDLLSAYLDGELEADEHNHVVSHLQVCDRCRSDLTEVHSARAMVRSLPTIEAPRWVLGEETEEEQVRRPMVWAAAAAAAVLVATVGIATWLTPTPELEVTYSDIATPHQVRASQDGTPTGVRLVQIVPFTPGGAE